MAVKKLDFDWLRLTILTPISLVVGLGEGIAVLSLYRKLDGRWLDDFTTRRTVLDTDQLLI